jgi:Icc-related predicted phosphoesterase
MSRIRMLVTCDLHGSETCWRKFLNASRMFEVDFLVVNGDITAKMIIPIVRSSGYYEARWSGQPIKLQESQVDEFENKCRMSGYIPYRTTREEAAEIQADEGLREALFERMEAEVMRRWLDLIPERVPDHVKVIITPGNDDKFSIDAVLRSSPRVIYGSDEVHIMDRDHEILCCGWTNPTPWNTPRELPEEKLYEVLKKLAGRVRNVKTSVFCIHCPPFNSAIDRAPQLDANLKPVVMGGHPQYVPVGSKAVRRIIEEYQPPLALHGHIHESPGRHRIGRTECINPGSEYAEGIFKGFLVEMDGERITKLKRVEG